MGAFLTDAPNNNIHLQVIRQNLSQWASHMQISLENVVFFHLGKLLFTS